MKNSVRYSRMLQTLILFFSSIAFLSGCSPKADPVEAVLKTSDEQTSYVLGTTISLDASDSTFDFLTWYVDVVAITDCADQQTCGFLPVTVGSYVIRIDASMEEVTDSNPLSGIFDGLSGAKKEPLEDSTSLDLTITPEVTAPTISDSTLTTSNVGNTEITLSWIQATDNLTATASLQYKVFYSTSNTLDSLSQIEAGTATGDYATNITSVTISGLSSSTTYYFNVLVKDETGNKNLYAMTSATTTTPASTTTTTVPSVAASSITFTDTDQDTGQIAGTVAITKASDESNITHYVLYWGSSSSAKLSGQSAVASLSTTGSNLSYTIASDTSIPSGATHWIVFTKNATGEMSTGTSVAITDVKDTTAPVPGDSGTLTISNVTTSSLTLSWTKATDNITAQSALVYKVYSSTSDNISTVSTISTNGTLRGTTTGDTVTLAITGLTSGTLYYFNVLVTDALNNSAVYTSKDKGTLMGNVYLFSGGTSAGNLGGRSGADARCVAEKSATWPNLACSNIRAFLSVDANDEIQDMPTNYGVPTNRPILGPTGTQIRSNWPQLWLGLDFSLNSAG
ncbi:MAG: fibronectin type III domain-containing protein, partial [SAR324 cluster bacterium]|nr:fibronectin type III domain-containing protein [SAR324 cluster bacterium]